MPRTPTPTQRAVDALIAVGFVLLMLVGSPFVGALVDVAVGLVVLLLGAALALRRWSPAIALVVAWSAAVVQMALAIGPNVWDAAIPAIVYACAAYGVGPVRWAAFASSFVGGAIAGVYVSADLFLAAMSDVTRLLGSAVAGFATVAVLTAALLLLSWTIGVLVATARQSQRNRQQAVQAGELAAAEQERTRIARDMHDVVAHSLSVVIAQSDGARLLRRTDPEAVDEALGTIGATARAALADVRVLLQQLRYEGTTAVQPGLGDLDALMQRFRDAGLDVTLGRSGAIGEAGTSAQLAAFRIVQESLTNALRHGDTARAVTVALTRTPRGLDLDVVNATRPARGRAAPEVPAGHGLIGMRERATSLNGALRAGADGDRFVVHASLPVVTTPTVQVVP